MKVREITQLWKDYRDTVQRIQELAREILDESADASVLLAMAAQNCDLGPEDLTGIPDPGSPDPGKDLPPWEVRS